MFLCAAWRGGCREAAGDRLHAEAHASEFAGLRITIILPGILAIRRQCPRVLLLLATLT